MPNPNKHPILAMSLAAAVLAVPVAAFAQTSTPPDGTPGNPPGTAIGRAIDRATSPAASAMAPNSALAQRPRISQIIGRNVYNERNESIGEVEDVLLSPSGDRPMAVIQVGGFLGLGGRLVSLPLTDLRWSSERSHFQLPGATKEQLQARPAYEYPTTGRG